MCDKRIAQPCSNRACNFNGFGDCMLTPDGYANCRSRKSIRKNKGNVIRRVWRRWVAWRDRHSSFAEFLYWLCVALMIAGLLLILADNWGLLF